MCPFYSTLSIIALASLSQLLYWGVHYIDMCLTFLLYNQRCDNHVGEAQYLLQKLQVQHHSTMYGGRHLPFAYPAGGRAVARCPLDKIGTERETCQRGPMGPLCKPMHPHRAAFDHVLQQSVPRSILWYVRPVEARSCLDRQLARHLHALCPVGYCVQLPLWNTFQGVPDGWVRKNGPELGIRPFSTQKAWPRCQQVGVRSPREWVGTSSRCFPSTLGGLIAVPGFIDMPFQTRDGSGVPDCGPEDSNVYVQTRAMCNL